MLPVTPEVFKNTAVTLPEALMVLAVMLPL
jgi:hypothetical protein